MLIDELGALYAEVWWKHDAKDFTGVKRAYTRICQLLGHSKEAGQIAEHVAKAYKYSDEAEKQPEYYEKALDEMLIVRRALNQDDRISQAQIGWWKAFRSKNYASAAYYVLKQQVIMAGSIGINTLLAAYYFIRSGISHDKRDQKRTSKWLSKYWGCIIAQHDSKKQVPLPI